MALLLLVSLLLGAVGTASAENGPRDPTLTVHASTARGTR